MYRRGQLWGMFTLRLGQWPAVLPTPGYQVVHRILAHPLLAGVPGPVPDGCRFGSGVGEGDRETWIKSSHSGDFSCLDMVSPPSPTETQGSATQDLPPGSASKA